jgi:hypothetical protein
LYVSFKFGYAHPQFAPVEITEKNKKVLLHLTSKQGVVSRQVLKRMIELA